ncbi:hypothetical protein DKX38_009026 [Salix brachista]|uniref:Uncharacterized protein n=1 Tax=Salix brachista TaxID=2182728 RepID=A0A5N5M9G4_9ROSI|nr:hypothetical protein DKX38_009026 [Salix brachista]
MPWSMAIWIANMVWVGLIGLVSTCLIVADELASSLRTGDIGPFHQIVGDKDKGDYSYSSCSFQYLLGVELPLNLT